MESEPIWTKTAAENLVRHRSGMIYLNAKVAGKKIRRSLKTTSLKIAKVRRDDQIANLRRAVDSGPENVRTIGDALNLVEQRVASEPDLKERSREYYTYLFKTLRDSLPINLPGGAWTADAAMGWWKKFAAARSVTHVNNGLRMVKKAADVLRDAGLRSDNPAKDLRRMKTKDKATKSLPSSETLERVLESIRAEGKAFSEQVSQMIEFLAWSGLRIAEARQVKWEDVGDEWLTVTGGVLLTKNRQIRRVPINSKLREVLERRRSPESAGKIFTVKSPRAALTNACQRLGIEHLRIHDLRHWFATHAIEKGVDIPTVSKWLGHKDGGALAMRVYGHLRDEHSLSAAKKMG